MILCNQYSLFFALQRLQRLYRHFERGKRGKLLHSDVNQQLQFTYFEAIVDNLLFLFCCFFFKEGSNSASPNVSFCKFLCGFDY